MLVALLLAVPAAATACGEGAPPEIKWAKVSPSILPWEGGTITLSTEVESDCGGEVYAEVNTSGPLQWSFQMLPSGDPNSDVHSYRSEIGALPNYQNEPFYYEFAIRTLDEVEGSSETFAGGTEVAAAPDFDQSPYLSNAKVSPTSLGSEGGWVTISADITDDRGVSYAFANIMLPDESLKEVPLEAVSSSHFVGHFKAPPNYGTGAQKYPVTVYGQDDIGQESSEGAGAFSVAGRPGPLSIEIERGGSIGNVTMSRTAIRVITVHNSGSKWIKSSLALGGSSWFVLRNSSGRKIEFWIGPNESRRFWLEFTPATAATATGTLTLSRADGSQSPIVRSLSGRGIPPAT
jgi:hypothetical protein